jgi:4-diphosphocytidyl-2-C-methyl-D-erythritol kinase
VNAVKTDVDKVVENATAKINLSLDILGVLENGYHEVEMILQEIELSDEIVIEKRAEGIELFCDVGFLPTDSANLAWRAADKVLKHANLNAGVKISIAKRIPVAAGLAGGSTDAAAVIRGLDRLYGLGLDAETQRSIGLSLGADVPFCLTGGCAVARGIGERLTPVEGFGSHWVLLAKPNLGVSTPLVYQRYDASVTTHRPDTPTLISALMRDDLRYVAENMVNVLEPVTCQMHPVVGNIRRQLLQCGAIGAMMSGSGPTVFGFFRHYDRAQKAYKNLKKTYAQVYITRTVKRG